MIEMQVDKPEQVGSLRRIGMLDKIGAIRKRPRAQPVVVGAIAVTKGFDRADPVRSVAPAGGKGRDLARKADEWKHRGVDRFRGNRCHDRREVRAEPVVVVVIEQQELVGPAMSQERIDLRSVEQCRVADAGQIIRRDLAQSGPAGKIGHARKIVPFFDELRDAAVESLVVEREITLGRHSDPRRMLFRQSLPVRRSTARQDNPRRHDPDSILIPDPNFGFIPSLRWIDANRCHRSSVCAKLAGSG